MSSDNIAQLIYLGAFALVLGGGFLLTSRLKLGQTLQMAAIWALIFIGAIGAVSLWGDIQDDLFPHQTRSDKDGAAPYRAAGTGTTTSRSTSTGPPQTSSWTQGPQTSC